MGVAGQVLEHATRRRERAFCINYPILLNRRIQVSLESLRCCYRGELAVESQVAVGKRSLEQVDEFATEYATQDLHMDEEEPFAAFALFTGNPSRAIGRYPTSCHEAVRMRMMHQGLAPRVQHHETADFCSQMFRISGEFQQSFGSGTKQDVIQHAFVLQSQRGELLW